MAIQTINNGESGSAVRNKINTNFTDAIDRTNHTGTQAASTISDFASASRAQTEAELVAGTNITITPSGTGATRQLTIAASGGGGSPGGTDTQVQFNDGGVFGGASGWTWNKTTSTMTLASGTQTADNPAQTITQTWNNAGATFTGLRLNVTDTASNAGSLLADFQVGGVSRFLVDKTGGLQFNNRQTRLFTKYDGFIFTTHTSFPAAAIRYDYFLLHAPVPLRWGNVDDSSFDLSLSRDAANTLAQRNGTNAQTFRLYNTFTDAGNYERGFMQYSGNVLQIGHEGLGTGNNSRTIAFRTAGFNALTLDSTNARFNVNLEAATAYIGMAERPAPAAPATNGVRVYAEDNGSGKTRLMALFATGAAVQIAIEP